MTKLDGLKDLFTSFLLCAATTIVAPAQTFEPVADFSGFNGAGPNGQMVQGIDGSLYGTTVSGGNGIDCGQLGCGTIFKITESGPLTALYSFCVQNSCVDGSAPVGLILGVDGNLYGTTELGGANGRGTVFKISPKGMLTTLYSFCAQSGCLDGSQPFAGVTQAADGDLYGTTNYGGLANFGTVFKITTRGTLVTLHSFVSTDGAYPQIPLVQARNGSLYGATYLGGDLGCNQSNYGCGTLFKITAQGNLTSLYNFQGATDGEYPSSLIQANDGNFYGETGEGGVNNGQGTIFELTPSNVLTTFYTFCCGGGAPNRLVQGTDGNFYGTTQTGGGQDVGTVFKLTSSGVLTTLYSFCSVANCTDGRGPNPLMQATDGMFYGTTYAGGIVGGACNSYAYGSCGLVFRISAGLGPFVSFVRSSGKVGQIVEILGQGLKGTTKIVFNGTPATFTVRSGIFLTATVPVGATTGYLTLTTTSRTMTSNFPFTVIP